MSNGGSENVLSDGVFSLIRIHVGSGIKLSLVTQAATLGNFFNLHKCKMAAARYANSCYTRATRLRVILLIESIFNVKFFYFKVTVTH